MAFTKQGLSPSRLKAEVNPVNDPTGMRQAAQKLTSAYNNELLRQQGFPFFGQDPRSENYVSPDSELYAETLREARRKISESGGGMSFLDPYAGVPAGMEEYVNKHAPGALDEYRDYQNKYNQWLGQYTSPGLDAQIRAFEQGLPDLQFLGGQTSVANRINNNLTAYGISNLSQVGARAAADGTTEFYNKATGQALPGQVMHFKSNNQGTLRVGLGLDQNGNVVLRNDFEGPKMQFGDYAGAAILATLGGMAGGALAPALGSAVGSATGMGSTASGIAGQALAQGAVGAGTAAAQGGDAGKGFLMGALGGGLGAGVNQLNPAGYLGATNPYLTSAINKGLTGAVMGGIGAGANGGDWQQGAVTGGLGGATSGLIGTGLQEAGLSPKIAGPLSSMASKYLMARTGGAGGGSTPASTQVPQNSAAGLSAGTGRVFNLAGLTPQQQANVKSAFGNLQQLGAPGLDNVRWA